MYSVYADGLLLYSPILSDDGYIILSPRISYERNKSGSFSFTLPPQNPLYNSMRKLQTILTVYDNNEEIFRGRVLHDSKNFYNQKEVYCEGELSFLLDSIVRPYDYNGSASDLFRQYITNHNNQVEDTKQFAIGEVTVSGDQIVRRSSIYPSTWEEINDKCLEKCGGHIRVRRENGVRYIDWIPDTEEVNPQIIEFGVNMLDIAEYISADEVFTVLIPLGARGDDEERLTIASVNSGKDYIVDDSAVELFGHIVKTQTWDEIVTPETLLTKGRKYLESGIKLSISLALKAVDLHLIKLDEKRIRVGDMVRVVSIPHKIDDYFMCTKIEMDLVSPDSSEYNFGFSYSTMTERSIKSSSTIKSSLSDADTAASTANQAYQMARETQQVVATLPDDYISVKDFDDFKNEVYPKITAVYRFKGSVDNYDALPKSGNELGDVYNLRDTDANYAYTSSGWDKLSETIDLSAYATKSSLDALALRVEQLEQTKGA